jgi:isoleucyl-tRNA synthetase
MASLMTHANFWPTHWTDATADILPFIDDASNWYVRRSRKRFWKSDNDADKNNAYRTLHYVLVRLSVVMAPFTPFLAEELYRQLTDGESVHLMDWPGQNKIDYVLLKEMHLVRETISTGLFSRAKAGIKTRQPLSEATVSNHIPETYKDVIAEELNVKKVTFSDIKAGTSLLETHVSPELKQEGLVREIIRYIQGARKEAGLQVDDRIALDFQAVDQELQQAIDKHTDTIKMETLASTFTKLPEGFEATVKIDNKELVIRLAKIT